MATREKMLELRTIALAKPIKCADCGEEFTRTAPSQVRDPICQKAHMRLLKAQWAKNSYARKLAATQAAAGMTPPAPVDKLSKESKETKESIHSIPSTRSISSTSLTPPAPRNQHLRLVPVIALERAHGVIQGLWLEIARLTALVNEEPR